jgi:multidrug resistance efflux pump
MEEKMTKTYEPDSQFVDRLEWQLASEFRRMDRLKPSSGKIAVPRGLAALAIAFGVLTTGVTLIKAADTIRDSWRKSIEIARVGTEVKLKQAHLEATREMAARTEALASNGLIREDESQALKLAVEKAALDLDRSLLNLDEVKASGQAPRDELYAPVVGGRDFVSERMELERKGLELDLEGLQRPLKRFEELVEKGLVERDQLDAHQVEIAARKGQIEKIQDRLELRKRFVAGEATAEEVEIRGRISVAENDLRQAQARADSLKGRLDRLQALETRGMISETEVRQLQFALDAAKAELKLAALEVDVLEKIK